MALPLAQVQALNNLAQHLYPFLPGEAHPYADQNLSFASAAGAMACAAFWSGGSKPPAISRLLASTLEHRAECFCGLIVEVVQRGMTYRQNKRTPITREEMDVLNELVTKVGFKVPELWDPRFLDSLPSASAASSETSGSELSESALLELRKSLLAIGALPAQQRGLRFETFLGAVFEAFDLAPRSAFRLVGEQIDGSFQFQDETYLLEAKWQNSQIGQEELLVFSGKVAGKAKWSRGLLVSYSGFSQQGLEAFATGKATNIVCVDGLDLHHVLEHRLDLRALIRRKARRAAETNQAYVSVRDLFPEVQ